MFRHNVDINLIIPKQPPTNKYTGIRGSFGQSSRYLTPEKLKRIRTEQIKCFCFAIQHAGYILLNTPFFNQKKRYFYTTGENAPTLEKHFS